MPSPPGRKQIKVKQRFLLLLCLIEGWLQCITLLRRRGEQRCRRPSRSAGPAVRFPVAEGFARGPDLQDNGSPDLDLRRRRISTEGECRAQVSARRREPTASVWGEEVCILCWRSNQNANCCHFGTHCQMGFCLPKMATLVGDSLRKDGGRWALHSGWTETERSLRNVFQNLSPGFQTFC